MKLRWDPTEGCLWLGERRVDNVTYHAEDTQATPRLLHRTRQAIVTLPNGLFISIIWGGFTHSTNYRCNMDGSDFIEEPDNVELGIKNDFFLFKLDNDDTVASWIPVEFIGDIIDWAGVRKVRSSPDRPPPITLPLFASLPHIPINHTAVHTLIQLMKEEGP